MYKQKLKTIKIFLRMRIIYNLTANIYNWIALGARKLES